MPLNNEGNGKQKMCGEGNGSSQGLQARPGAEIGEGAAEVVVREIQLCEIHYGRCIENGHAHTPTELVPTHIPGTKQSFLGNFRSRRQV